MLATLMASLPKGLAYEVVLVDDASTDNTKDWLAQLDSPPIRTVVNPQNFGYAESVNRGAKLAQGNLLCVLNNDLLFSPGWLEPMLAIINDPTRDAGIVGNVQYRISDDALDHAGVRLNLYGQFEHIRDLPDGKISASLPWVTGACFLIRRDFFFALGGLDTCYRNGCEDLDLCFKVHKAKKKVWISYASRIRHHVSLSRGGPSQQDEYNSFLLFQKWHREIKHFLAEAWSSCLTKQECALLHLDGTINPDLMHTPNIAGRFFAELHLSIQIKRWQRMFGESELFSATNKPDAVAYPFPASTESTKLQFLLELKNCHALEAFHLCGIVSDLPVSELLLTVDFNSLHQKKFSLKPGRSFNLSFARPLLLPLTVNVATITVEASPSITWHAIREAFKLVHVVLNDETIDLR